MDTTNEIYSMIQGAERAVGQQRFELARAMAAIAQARATADIANALATIAAALADSDARDSLAQTVAIYGS